MRSKTRRTAADTAGRVRSAPRPPVQEARMDNPESRFYTAAGRYAKGGKANAEKTTYASPRKMEAMKGMSRGGNGVRNANGGAKVRKMNRGGCAVKMGNGGYARK
jgi:hypothetical protein